MRLREVSQFRPWEGPTPKHSDITQSRSSSNRYVVVKARFGEKNIIYILLLCRRNIFIYLHIFRGHVELCTPSVKPDLITTPIVANTASSHLPPRPTFSSLSLPLSIPLPLNIPSRGACSRSRISQLICPLPISILVHFKGGGPELNGARYKPNP